MEQEKGNFRGRVFGGFNRQDVIDYIEELATERNALARENQELQERLWELEDRPPEPAPDETGSVNGEVRAERDELVRAIDEARTLLRSVKSEYDALCADVKINATQAEGELRTISSHLSGIRTSLGRTGERLEEISSKLETKEE